MIRDIILLLLLTLFSTATLAQGFEETEILSASNLEDKGRCGADENDMDILWAIYIIALQTRSTALS